MSTNNWSVETALTLHQLIRIFPAETVQIPGSGLSGGINLSFYDMLIMTAFTFFSQRFALHPSDTDNSATE